MTRSTQKSYKIDPEVASELYLDCGTTKSIAEQLGCSASGEFDQRFFQTDIAREKGVSPSVVAGIVQWRTYKAPVGQRLVDGVGKLEEGLIS